VRARVTGIDLLTLDLHAQLLQRLDEPVTTDDSAADVDEEAETSGPLTLAIDLAEPADDAGPAGERTADPDAPGAT
jgi:exoribonuclease-2